ncbi:MAG: helix-turn-helix transcriptional regulator [bacterium]|nr:helix-turn-helix transcriptional regulator [bacterium]MDY4100963.1 helix-turn-helix transcriptional regulator [Lachnospiraceae bacterium]
MREDLYGEQVKELRLKMGMTQSEVAQALDVTPGYISNVENGRTAMSLRILIYYAKLMGISLDSLVGQLEPEYQATAIDRDILNEISKLDDAAKKKLLQTLKIWNDNE